MKKYTLLLALLSTQVAQAKLVDKVVAIFNSKVLTLSQIERILTNLPARKNVSPQIYNKEKMSDKDIVNLIIRNNMIREKLVAIGYNVTDEQVEEQIKSTEKRLGLGRPELLKFLSTNNLTFDEYFEIIRETIEFNIFSSRVIAPLISVTEQQIKNTYYNRYLGNKTVSFKYGLTDYSIPGNLSGEDSKLFKESIAKYHTSGIIPDSLRTIETNQLENLSEDGLTPELIKELKVTDEGAFTKVVDLNGTKHIFFVKKKDLMESEQYIQSKERIRNELFEESAKNITNVWFDRESPKHFIKYNL
jgi:peptidyl-prolyl cis-trans isomerase SurA